MIWGNMSNMQISKDSGAQVNLFKSFKDDKEFWYNRYIGIKQKYDII